MATGWFSVGPGRPLVTVPILRPSLLCSSVCSRTGTPSSATRPTRLRGRLAGLSIWASTLSAPGKPPARAPPLRRTFCIAQSSAASDGGVLLSMSLPYTHQPASNPPHLPPPPPKPWGPAPGRRRQAPRQALGLRCRQRKLEAVLAGVAAAGHQAVAAGDGVVATGHEAQFF